MCCGATGECVPLGPLADDSLGGPTTATMAPTATKPATKKGAALLRRAGRALPDLADAVVGDSPAVFPAMGRADVAAPPGPGSTTVNEPVTVRDNAELASGPGAA